MSLFPAGMGPGDGEGWKVRLGGGQPGRAGSFGAAPLWYLLPHWGPPDGSSHQEGPMMSTALAVVGGAGGAIAVRRSGRPEY